MASIHDDLLQVPTPVPHIRTDPPVLHRLTHSIVGCVNKEHRHGEVSFVVGFGETVGAIGGMVGVPGICSPVEKEKDTVSRGVVVRKDEG